MSDLRQTLQTLRGLQELDRELYRVQEELRRLPQERARRQERLRVEEERLAELERQLQMTRVRIKEIEDLTTGQRQRVRKLENQANESRGDAALMVAFQHEIRGLKRDIGEAEEEGLTLVEEVERQSAEREAQRAALEVLRAELVEYGQNVQKEIEEASARAEGLQQERRKRGGDDLPADVLVSYEKLLEAREGQALAELDGRVCQGCYVSVPNNIYVRLARSLELVPCPSCGRILYLRDE